LLDEHERILEGLALHVHLFGRLQVAVCPDGKGHAIVLHMIDGLLEADCVLFLAVLLGLQGLKGLVDLATQKVLLAIDQLSAVWIELFKEIKGFFRVLLG